MDLRRAEIEGPRSRSPPWPSGAASTSSCPRGSTSSCGASRSWAGADLRLRDVPIVPGSPRIVVRGFAVMGGIDVKSRPNRSGKQLARRPHRAPRRRRGDSPTWRRSARTSAASCTRSASAQLARSASEQRHRDSRHAPHRRHGHDPLLRHGRLRRHDRAARRPGLASESCASTIASCATPSPATVGARSTSRGTGSWWRSVAWPAPCGVPSTSSAPSSPTSPPTTASRSPCTSASTPGDAVDEGDDYLGHTVIVASRLADAAGAGRDPRVVAVGATRPGLR